MKRRQFTYSSLGIGTAMIAGCVGDDSFTTDSDDSNDDGEDRQPGTFRLLISDQPTDIDDFDSLEVSFSSARVFRGDGEDMEQDDDVIDDEGDGQGDDEDDAGDDEADDAGTDDEEQEDDNENGDDSDVDDDDSEGDDGDSGEAGFVEFDLDGATVDLTQVLGEKAIAVLEDELEPGMYSTIELRAQDIEGIVDGDAVTVTIPSERLRIVRPFEVTADEELSFVFDINVVQRGRQDRYNLLPVIGQSGVVGRDVEAEEIDPDDDDSDSDEETDDEDDSTDDAGAPDDQPADGDSDQSGGPPDDQDQSDSAGADE